MKIIRKLTPVSLYDILGLEQWFEEMAREGLFPLRTKEWTTFRDGGQPGTRFRLEPMGKGKEPDQAQLDLYREAGWEYACPVPGLFYLFYATDPSAPELHTDRVTKGQGLDRLARKSRRMKLFLILYFAILPLLIFLPLLFPASRFDSQLDPGAQFFFSLVKLGSPAFVCLLVAYFVLSISQIKQLRQLLALHRNLKEGLPPPPSPGPRRRIVAYHLLCLGLTVLLLLNLITNHFPRQVALEQFNHPYVVLSQVEGMELTPFEGDCWGKGEFSLLAPVWYTVDQRGYILNDEVPSGMGFSIDPGDELLHYAPSLDLTYLELTIPAMARPVAESVMNEMRLVNLYWNYEEADHPDADFVILAQATTRPYQMAAVGKGGRIAVFRYGGQETLADHLDQLVQMVD